MIRLSCRRALLLLVVIACLTLYASYIPGSQMDGILKLGLTTYYNVATNASATMLRTGSNNVSSSAPAADHDPDDQNSTQQNILQQVVLKYDSHILSLRNLKLRYYVYDSLSALQMADDPRVLRNDIEDYIFSALLTNNTWRVTDPALADLFFAPTPFVAYTRFYGNVRRMMIALTRHPIFNEHQGHRHVVFALGGRWFDGGRATLNPYARRFNWRWAPRLQNVSVARDYDAVACQKLSEDEQDYGDWNSFFSTFRPVSNNTFSIGMLSGAILPLIPATYEKFAMTNYTLFYHTRTSPSDNGSTPYRKAPLNVALPFNASIGYDIPPDQWLERFISSKFCLVIRGDDPMSRALLRAVKVGCIPVVVSYHFPVVGPTFKTSLDMRDFSVFLDEKEFLKNPQEQLASLQDIPELEIRTKLFALRYAQQVTCPEHPDSLFLPALMLEANESFQPTYTH